MQSSFRQLPNTSWIAFVLISLLLLSGWTPDPRANAWYPDNDVQSMSDDEAKQIQIAERFASVLERSPRRGTALERVYGHHVEYGTLDEYLSGLRERVEKTPTDGTGWMILGLFEAHRGQDADAVEAFAQAEKYRTEDALPAYYMGQSLILIGQPDKAVEAFERAIARKPRRADLLEVFQQLGRVHQRAQRTDVALEVWNRLESLFPDDIRVQEQIAVTLVEEGEYALALPRYEKLATQVNDDYRKIMFRIEAAELKIRENRRDDGVADYESMLADLNPTSWLFRDVRHRIEEVFLRSGDQDGLVKYYEKWIESHPEDVGGMARLAKFLASSARVPEASQWMEKALALAPTRTELRKSFIDQLVDDQRYDEAIQQYSQLVKSAPGNQDFLRDWGRLIMKNKKLDADTRQREATKIWNRIVAARPDDALTNAQVADLYRQANLNDRAIALYKKAIELSPNDPQYREYLGEFYHILKRPDDAQATWSSIADGPRHNAVNVARLAEVYNSFGYLDQAVEQIAEACRLEPKEFTLHARAAEYHVRAGEFDDALRFIDIATELAENDEQRDSALRGRIEVFQNSRRLDDEIERLQAELKDSQDASANDWHTLARYLEADRRWAEATEAVEEALSIDPGSILALSTSARIAELAGDYSRAAEVNRKLAEVDRRSRSEHLMNVARLEAQMGRSEEALSAGRELIVSAPGNTDNYEFYAQLCFQLGKNGEALDSLRKAVRINPTEPHLTMALGAALSREFRTDEAIEVYWRAFEKTTEIDDKTALTEKLAGLYGQINRFDKLTERFERDQREESKRREMTICLAQAHQTSGDYGAARRELEGLLSKETRDTNLLQQLSKLCEASSDNDEAINYQRQLVSIAPGHETEYRLAKLLQSRGDMDEASEILVKLTRREENPSRLLRSLDSLMKQQSFESVIAVTEPLLSESRDDWELLYREAVAFASMQKIPQAKLRFERLLSLNFPHDTLGIEAQEKLKRDQAKSRSDNLRGIQSRMPKRQSPLSMLSQASQVQRATGMSQDYYSGNALPEFWSPQVYGVARMAAYGWLMQFEETASEAADNDQEEPIDTKVAIADQVAALGATEGADRELIYDWMYVEQLRNNYKTLFEIGKKLAMQGGLEEQKYFLNSLRTRGMDATTVRSNSGQSQPELDPLSNEEIELMMQCFDATNSDNENAALAMGGGQIAYGGDGQMYVNIGGRWVKAKGIGLDGLSAVLKELKLAGQDQRAEKLLNAKMAEAESSTQIAGMLGIVFNEDRYDDLPDLYSKWTQAASKEIALAPNTVSTRRRGNANKNEHSANQLQSALGFLTQWTGKLGAEEENEQVLEIMDRAFSLMVEEGKKRRIQQASSNSRRSVSTGNHQSRLSTMYGQKRGTVQIDYPRANTYVDTTGLNILRQTFEILKRNDVLEDLPKHLRQRVADATKQNSDDLLYEQLMLGYVLWWMDENDEAVEVLTAASNQLADDPSFRFEMAQLHQRRGDFDEALAIVDSIKPRDQKLVQQRELHALQLAERLGDIDRAKSAAERLFGLRLDTATQVQLVQQMRRLGLLEMSEAVVSRLQRRSGNQISSLASLMTLYQGQGKTDLAEQIANRILQRTKSPLGGASNATRNPLRYNSSGGDSASRTQALRVLQQTGALKEIVARVESRLERDPDSTRFLGQLIEFYEIANDRDRVKTLLDKAVKARPDAMIFRYKLAKHHESAGKMSKACDQYLAILKQNPRWITDDFYQVRNAFRRSKRSLDLLKTIEEMDLKSFGQPYYLVDLVSTMMRNQEREQEGIEQEIVIDLVERMFDEFPDYRNFLMSNMRGKDLWKNDRIYEIARKGMIPGKNAKIETWFGIGDISSYQSNGRVNGQFQQMISGIKGTRKEKDFYDAIEKSLVEHPEWAGGKIMLAIIDISGNRREAGKKRLREIFEDPTMMKDLNRNTAWLIGQELDQYEDTRELAVEILEQAVAAPDSNSMNQFQYSPAYRLVELYARVGRKEDARKILMEQSRISFTDNRNPGYASYQRIENTKMIGDQLAKMGFHIDAVLVYRTIIEDKQAFEQAKLWGGNNREAEIRSGMEESLKTAIQSENSAAIIDQLLSARERLNPGGAAVDLLISVPTAAKFREQSVESQLFTLIEKLGASKKGLVALNDRVEKLKSDNPEDLSTALIDAFVSLKFSPDNAADSIDQLEKYFADNPLDELPDGRRPNSRQRRQAKAATDVWLISRECLASEEHRPAGQRLARIAVRGARRQVDKDALVSILYDWGKADIANGQRANAEKKWSDLLDEVTRRPTVRKKRTEGAGPRKVPAVAPCKTSRNKIKPEPIHSPAIQRMTPVLVSYPQQPTSTRAGNSTRENVKSLVPPLTLSQFRISIQIAHAAADSDMPNLSRRAVMKSLAGGLPVADPVFTDPSSSSGPVVRSSGGNVAGATDPIQTEVATSMREILGVWAGKEGYPAKEVYELLCPLVFSVSRPTEIMMYEDSSGISDGKVESLGVTLVKWAGRADMFEDLKQRIEQRKSNDASRIPAAVLAVHIHLNEKEMEKAHEKLVELAELTSQSAVQQNVRLSCHAAFPAAQHPELEKEAVQILRKALDMQTASASQNSVAPLGQLAETVNRYLAKQGDEQAIRDFYEQYISRRQNMYSSYDSDYGQYMFRQDIAQIANTAARSGVIKVAMDFMGRFADSSFEDYRYGRSSNVKDAALAATYAVRTREAADRYATWRNWTLPAEGRQTVRMFNHWDPECYYVVPSEFRKRDVVDGPATNEIVSNLHELIHAAKESGNIEELTAQAKAAHDKNLPNANFLYTLLLIEQNDFATAGPLVEDLIKTFRKRMKRTANQSSPDLWGDYLVCRACMEQSSEFANLYRQGGNALVQVAKSQANRDFVSGLGFDFARRRATDLGSNIEPGTDAQLNFWFPISDPWGNRKSWWVKDNEKLAYLAGPSEELLCFRYPLVGDFQFSFDAFNGSWAEGDAGYGGLIVETQYWQARPSTRIRSLSRHDSVSGAVIAKRGEDDFCRIRIACKDGDLKYWCDDSLVYQEQLSGTSPWVMLRTEGVRKTAFRNFLVEGSPEIPRQVNLFADDRMDGWSTRFFSETQPGHRALAESKNNSSNQHAVNGRQSESATDEEPEYDWWVSESLLHGRSTSKTKSKRQSYVHYQRPLLNGESFSYEFFYVPGWSIANPTIGRTAVVIDLDRISEHWISKPGRDEMLFGVEPDNLNPESKYATSKTAGLRPDDWNSVSVTMRDGQIQIAVNESTIYQRPSETVTDTRFGLFRFKHQSAKVRNAKLTGNWPDELAARNSEDLLASTLVYAVEDKRLIHELIADRFVRSEIDPLLVRAAKLPPNETYDLLKDWVLPNQIHSDFRMHFKFPRVQHDSGTDADSEQNRNLICPAIELVQAAVEAEKIDELVSEIERYQPRSQLAEKSKSAMLFLAATAQQNGPVAIKSLSRLFQTIDELGESVPEDQRSPEMLVAWHAALYPEFQTAAYDIAKKLDDTLVKNSSATYRRRVNGLCGRVAVLRLGEPTGDQNGELNQWTGIPGEGDGFDAAGFSPSRWRMSDRGILNHIPGELRTQLIFQSPLQGKFEVHADMTTGNPRATFLTYGMRGSLVQDSGNPVRNLTVLKSSDRLYLRTALPGWGEIAHFKLQIEGSTVRTFINDVEVHEEVIDGLPEPWLLLHPEAAGNRAAIRNLRILGDPEIPDELNLSETDMAAWHASRFGERFSTDESDQATEWIKDGDEILGRVIEPNPDRASLGEKKSLLNYHRPLLEDCEFEFDSFYTAGKFECHPAIGSSALIVGPDRVRVLDIGEGTGKEAGQGDSKADDNRNGGSTLVNLKEDDWNKFLVKLTGNRLTLTVNEVEVLRYEIDEPLMERRFGFFRYADKFEARIRRIRYRGDWPKRLPTIDEQELAYAVGGALAVDAANVSESLDYNLARSQEEIVNDGLTILGPTDKITMTDDGSILEVGETSRERDWPGFSFTQPIEGDFDATIDFNELNLSSIRKDKNLGFDLQAMLDDSNRTIVAMGVRAEQSDKQMARASFSHQQPNNDRAHEKLERNEESNSGLLRLARRGREIHCLFAARGDPFELIESYIVGEAKVKELRIVCNGSDKEAKMSVRTSKFSLVKYNE